MTLTDERTPHFRTFATIAPDDEADSGFAVRKRDHRIMAEKTFYRDGDFSASFVGGRHRQQKWMTGLSLNYAF